MGLVINFLIVLASLAGIVFILWRKIPLLRELPEEPQGMRALLEEQAKDIVSSQKKKWAASAKVGKTLSKARMVASKTERQTGEWFERLHKKSEEHKEEFSDSYWDQLRKRSIRRGRKKK